MKIKTRIIESKSLKSYIKILKFSLKQSVHANQMHIETTFLFYLRFCNTICNHLSHICMLSLILFSNIVIVILQNKIILS